MQPDHPPNVSPKPDPSSSGDVSRSNKSDLSQNPGQSGPPTKPDDAEAHPGYASNSPHAFTLAVESFSPFLPHLKNVLAKSRNPRSRVSVWDYLEDMTVARPPQHTLLRFEDPEVSQHARQVVDSIRHNVPPHCMCRLILVEDICSYLVRYLSVVFGMSPEVCEEHLANSGLTERYLDEEPRDWVSRHTAKEHISLRWYRPYRISLEGLDEASLPLSRDKVLDFTRREHETVRIGFSVDSVETAKHHIFPSFNTWRRYLDFRYVAEGPMQDDDLVVWEEKVTIWRRRQQDCLFVIMLVDHPPHVTKTTEVTKDTKTRQQRWARSVTSNAESSLDNAIQEGPSSVPGSASCLQIGQEKVQTDPDVAVSAAAPDLSAVSQRKASCGSQHPAMLWADGANNDDIINPATPVVLAQTDSNVRVDEDTKASGSSSQADYQPEEAPAGFVVKNIAARGPIFDRPWPLSGNMSGFSITGTFGDLSDWLNHQSGRDSDHGPHLQPGTAIFNILHNDLQDFFRIVDGFLDFIAVSSTDDAAVQRYLPRWRSLLDILERELRYFEETVPMFASFLRSMSTPDAMSPRLPSIYAPDTAEKLLPTMMTKIATTQNRLRQSFHALVASVSILESRRGIAEAESVTKLTELAFFFIPLSFTASFFSMQVKELSGPSLSIWAFFLLASSVSMASYGLRLVLRSSHFLRRLHQFMNVVREDAGIALGRPVPTRDFVLFLWHRSQNWIVLATWITATIIPLVPVWASQLLGAIKAIVSVLVILTSVFTLSILQGAGIPTFEQLALSFAQSVKSRHRRTRRTRSAEDDHEA